MFDKTLIKIYYMDEIKSTMFKMAQLLDEAMCHALITYDINKKCITAVTLNELSVTDPRIVTKWLRENVYDTEACDDWTEKACFLSLLKNRGFYVVGNECSISFTDAVKYTNDSIIKSMFDRAIHFILDKHINNNSRCDIWSFPVRHYSDNGERILLTKYNFFDEQEVTTR